MSTSSYASVSSSKSNEDFDQDNETQLQIKLEEESKNMAEALVSVQDLVSDQVQDFHSLKRQINNITTLVKDNKPIAILQSRSEYVRHIWMTCQQRNSQIHRLVTPEERKSLPYIKGNEFGTIELLLFEALDSIAERIAAESPLQLGSTSTPHHDSYHSEFTHSASDVKLPQINLITFSGQFTEWQTFHDTFVSLVKNNNSLDNISKLHYLRSTLRGEALDTICHIQLTAANFEVAWDLLIKQYDNKIALVNAHLNAIFSMESIKKESASKLALLRNSVKKHIGALQNLGRLTDGYDDILINRVVTLLDLNTKRDWELWLASQAEYPKYSDLDAFLVGRIRALESLFGLASENATFSHETSKGNQRSKFNIGKSHHASAFGNKCPVCNHNHYINQCKRFKESSVHERFNLVKQYKLCTNCLKANHRVSDCLSKFDCFKCNGKHHTLLHRDTSSDVVKRDDSNIVQYPSTLTNGMQIAEQKIGQSHFLSSNSINPSRILLATARVWVLSPANRAVRVRALLDQGSTWTFMSRDLAHALGVKRTPISASWAGVGGSEAGTATSMANIRLSPNMIGNPAFETQAIILPKITSYIPDFQVPKRRWAHLDNLNLADDSNNEDPIHLLIGADLYGALILDGLRKGKINEPVAQNTVFVWIISGNIEHKNSNATQSIVTHHCITNKDLDASLRNFWEIEEISSKPVPSIEDELCELHFRQTHSRDADGRYIVRIPFKSETPLKIGESRHVAEKSLKRIETRLAKNELHRSMYVDFMQEYETLNHMEPVLKSKIYPLKIKPVYIPHHPIFRESSQTTKLRVVFNASSKTSNNTSLNDHMHIGPALQSDFPTILLNWRSFQFVYTADIAKMYRQILIDSRDVDYQRILWRYSPDLPIQEYRLLTVAYGTRSAPFLALRVIKQLVEDEGAAFPLAIPILLFDTFVDDILFGAHDIHLAKQIREELISLLDKAKLQARKWSSNSTELLEDIDPSDHGLAWSTPMDDNDGVKILGLHWNPKTDSFGFKVSHQSLDCVTKRSVLSLLAKLYDPMGWISPVIVTGKIFMQQLWRDQYSWDDPLPENLALSIVQYFNSMPKLSQIKIPRWTGLSPSVSDVQIHGFSDASEQAYGAVVYLRITKPSGENIVSLLASKTKVAPLKQLSIPRLELEAAVLLSRLVVSIRNARSLSQIPYQCWTDSSVVLAWLSQHASKWKTFVANRVSEIHSLVPECQWRYVPTDTNPADLASRGKSVDELVTSSLWWNGPSWLPESTEKWPSGLNTDTSFFNLEEKLQVYIANTRNDWFEQLSNLFTRCSKWSKILRVVATVFKFVHILRSKVKGQNLKLINQISAEDLNQAEEHVIKHLQQSMFKAEIKALEDEQPLPAKSKLLALNPFLENGILRVGGRLARSELPFDAKHPIVLSRHRITTLIIENVHHRCLHGGVKLTLSTLRQAFWVLNPRPQVKSVINRCLQCAKIRAKMATQIMADLPSRRVTRPDKLFTDCGVDYAGPLQFRLVLGRGLVYQPRPCYIAIFVCFAVKAIHLELVTDYSTETFIAAFKRFTSRRGFPARMYSDCGTNFRGADRVLQSAVQAAYDSTEFRDLLAEDRIVWNFNPPAAPHFGGLWEAGVRSVKGHLKRILGDKKPTLEEFTTLLCQIEAALNSRPLGPLNDTIDDFEPLTPGHFLTGGSLIAVPQPTLINLNSNRLSRWEQIQQCFELFWRRWSTDYLTSLQQRSKWRNETIPLKKGQLVLLKQPNLPPTKCLLGRVEECRPGADGRIRVVQVRTAKSSFLRPITELALLPIDLDSPGPYASSR